MKSILILCIVAVASCIVAESFSVGSVDSLALRLRRRGTCSGGRCG